MPSFLAKCAKTCHCERVRPRPALRALCSKCLRRSRATSCRRKPRGGSRRAMACCLIIDAHNISLLINGGTAGYKGLEGGISVKSCAFKQTTRTPQSLSGLVACLRRHRDHSDLYPSRHLPSSPDGPRPPSAQRG